MAIMLATYQYFTAKRSSDIVLNKDELQLQAELTCLKQFHDFASSKNEFLTNTEANIISLKGNGENQAMYSCNGADDPTLTVSKYCLNATGKELVNCNFEGISCGDSSATAPGYHCVSTTKWKTFSKDDKYLMSQILKTGVYVSSDVLSQEKNLYLVKDKGAIFSAKPENIPEGSDLRGIGLVSCVNACKVSLQIKLQGAEQCEEGQVIVPRDDGTFICAKPTDASPCTAHESEELTKKKENCIEKNGKFCCPIDYHGGDENYCKNTDPRPSNCCPPGTNPQWDSGVRFYRCTDGTEVCQGSFPMKIVDEKGNTPDGIGPIRMVNSAATAKYQYDSISKMGNYYCHLTQSSFVDACKKFEEDYPGQYSYLKVSNITNNTNITQDDFSTRGEAIQPVCHLASKANAKSAENCTPCQGVEFDQLNNKWKCRDYTWNEIKTNLNGARDVVFGENAKGLKTCLSTCSNAQIEKIKAGKRNGKYWGLRFDSNSKMWNCFNCKPEDTYNLIYHCNGGADIRAGKAGFDVMAQDEVLTHTASSSIGGTSSSSSVKCNRDGNWEDSSLGKCIPFNCASEYQVQINGKCYTKWCNRNLPGFPENAEINEPTNSNCPKTSPWMAFNRVKSCVYCVRNSPERIIQIIDGTEENSAGGD